MAENPYPVTSAKGRVHHALSLGPLRAVDLMAVAGLKRGALRTTISRLRDDGWDIICKRDTSGPTGQASDPKYELLLASSSAHTNQEQAYKKGDRIYVD